MRINADFSQAALVIPSDDAWIHSPETGVDRLMLDRVGDEVARATSLVRYHAGSSFREHRHDQGEEFLVLDGVFSDQAGDFPTGTYVRNPPGTSHAPHSKDGCRILVKLRQFDLTDLAPVVVDTVNSDAWSSSQPGIEKLHLHTFGNENVSMLRLVAGSTFELNGTIGGAEILLVSGTAQFNGQRLSRESWLRIPVGQSATLQFEKDSEIWTKTGHLTGAL